MNDLLNKLEKLATNESNERALRNINNLIGRIKHYDATGNEEKFNECLAEAELWLA